MRILVVTHAIHRGGAQDFLLEMLGSMKANGLDIGVLTSESAEHSFLLDLKKLGVRTHIAPYKPVANYPDMAVERVPAIVESSDLVWLADEIYLVASRIKRIRRGIPVIAHVHCGAIICPMWHKTYGLRQPCTRKCSVTRIIRCKQLGNKREGELRIIGGSKMRVYELLDLAKGPVDLVRWPMKGSVIESIDGFVAPSGYMKDLMLSHMPQLETLPFEVIRNPVVVSDVGNEEINRKDRTMILYASGDGLLKGPHIALNATKELLDGGNKAVLTMIGVRGYTWIQKLVARLGIEKHVELLPRLDRRELHKRMANSDFVLMPSIIAESFGRIPVEANRLGTPAIVSDRGALPETIVDGVTGILASTEGFPNALSMAVGMDWNRERIVDATRRFDPEVITKDFIRFLERFT